jgi:hypothetical protein
MHKVRCGCAAIMLLIAGACQDNLFAGGWDRFDQGVDLLFDPSKVVVDVGLFDLIPNRKFNTVNGVPETVNTAPNIFRPSVNAKFVPFEDTACLATYRQPFGLLNDYGSTWSQPASLSQEHLRSKSLVSPAHIA